MKILTKCLRTCEAERGRRGRKGQEGDKQPRADQAEGEELGDNISNEFQEDRESRHTMCTEINTSTKDGTHTLDKLEAEGEIGEKGEERNRYFTHYHHNSVPSQRERGKGASLRESDAAALHNYTHHRGRALNKEQTKFWGKQSFQRARAKGQAQQEIYHTTAHTNIIIFMKAKREGGSFQSYATTALRNITRTRKSYKEQGKRDMELYLFTFQ